MRVLIICCFFLFGCASSQRAGTSSDSSYKDEITETLRKQVLEEAAWALQQEPVTVTAQTSSRSAGGKHDFFSEGDYWWPNPKSVDSPLCSKRWHDQSGQFCSSPSCYDPFE